MRVPMMNVGSVMVLRPAAIDIGSAGVGARRAAMRPRRSPTVSKYAVAVVVAVPRSP